MEKRAINILLLSVLMSFAVMLMPVSVRAETDTAPTVMYKLINHDCIKLKWDEVAGADGYYIYRTDTGTGKMVKCKKLVTDTEFTVKGLEANTDYVFRVAAVSGGKVGDKSADVELTTPCEWYYKIDAAENNENKGKVFSNDFRITICHYNNTSEKKYDLTKLKKHIEYLIEKYVDNMSYYIDDVYGLDSDLETVKQEFINEIKDSCRITNIDHSRDYVYLNMCFQNPVSDPIYNNEVLVKYILRIRNNKNDRIESYKERDDTVYTYSDDMVVAVNHLFSDDDDSVSASNYYVAIDPFSRIIAPYYYKDKYVFSNVLYDKEHIYFLAFPTVHNSSNDGYIFFADKTGANVIEKCKIFNTKKYNELLGDIHNIILVGTDESNCYYILKNKSGQKQDYSLFKVSIKRDSEQYLITGFDINADFNIRNIKIGNKCIYIEGNNIYYRINIGNSETTTQDTPFEWYY